jgi:hypothetical protein
MGKKEQKQQLADIKAQQADTKTQYAALTGAIQSRQSDLDLTSGESREAAKNAYSGFLNAEPKKATHIGSQTTSFSPISYTDQHLTADKVDPADKVIAGHSSLPGYKEISETGGYNDAQRASIGGDVSNLREIGRTGGLDDAAMARMRGGGVYDEFAKTGGYSDADIGNIRSKALSPIGAANTAMQDELQRRRAVQGGYAPGFDASSRALRRDTARSAADTSLNTELGIREAVNKGRQWGAGGLSTSETALQGLRTGNMLQGSQAAANTEMALQNAINANKLGGLSGMQANDLADLNANTFNAGQANQIGMFNSGQKLAADTSSANLNMQGWQFANSYNQQGQQFADSYNQQDRMFAEQMNQRADQFADTYNQQNQMFGATGMGALASQDNANQQANINRGLDILSQGTNAQLGYGGLQNQLVTQPSGWGQAAGALAGGLGSYLGSGGSLGGAGSWWKNLLGGGGNGSGSGDSTTSGGVGTEANRNLPKNINDPKAQDLNDPAVRAWYDRMFQDRDSQFNASS